jgi:trans-aconitate methyltransferase
VCDLGCGPGHVSRYLWERGVEVCGIDLSSELVERARRLNPGKFCISTNCGDRRFLSISTCFAAARWLTLFDQLVLK